MMNRNKFTKNSTIRGLLTDQSVELNEPHYRISNRLRLSFGSVKCLSCRPTDLSEVNREDNK